MKDADYGIIHWKHTQAGNKYRNYMLHKMNKIFI